MQLCSRAVWAVISRSAQHCETRALTPVQHCTFMRTRLRAYRRCAGAVVARDHAHFLYFNFSHASCIELQLYCYRLDSCSIVISPSSGPVFVVLLIPVRAMSLDANRVNWHRIMYIMRRSTGI